MKVLPDDHQMTLERTDRVVPLNLPLQSASERCKLEYIEDVLPYSNKNSRFAINLLEHCHYVSPSVCLTVCVMGKEVLLMARSAMHGHESVRIARKNLPRPGILTKLFHRPWPPLKKLLEPTVEWRAEAVQCLRVASFTRIKGSKLANDLFDLDCRLIAPLYKVGLVYATADQEDFEAMLGNHPCMLDSVVHNFAYSTSLDIDQVSPAFWQFARWLAQEIKLQGWSGFAGGLDTRDDATGRTAFYTRWQQYEIIFHTAPLIPCPDYDKRRVMRKRHVGNDMVLIVFQESRTDTFPLESLVSRQTHILILVTPVSAKTDGQLSLRVQPFKRRGCATIPAYACWDHELLMVGNVDDRDKCLATGRLPWPLTYNCVLTIPVINPGLVIQAEWASHQCSDVAPLLMAYRLMLLQDLHTNVVRNN